MPAALEERAVVDDEARVDRVERRPLAVLAREPAVEVRRVLAFATARRVRVVGVLVPRAALVRLCAVARVLERDDVARRLVPVPADVRAERKDLRVLVAIRFSLLRSETLGIRLELRHVPDRNQQLQSGKTKCRI